MITPNTCPKCSASMILTRSGNQLVCSKCDHFERLGENPNATPAVAAPKPAPVAHASVAADKAKPAVAAKVIKAPKAAPAKEHAKPAPAAIAAPKAAHRRGEWAQGLADLLERATKLAMRGAEAFSHNAHPRSDEIVKLLTVAASSIDSCIPHVDHWPTAFVGAKPARATAAPRGPRPVPERSAAILKFALANETFSLSAVADYLMAYTPKGWDRALVAKRAVPMLNPLIDRGALRKISAGVYAITGEGAELAKTVDAPKPLRQAPAAVAKAPKPVKAAKTKPAAKAHAKRASKAADSKAPTIGPDTRVAIKGEFPKGLALVVSPSERKNLVVCAIRGKKAAVQNADGGIRFEIDLDRLEAVS